MCLKSLITETGVALGVLLITKLLIQFVKFAEVRVKLNQNPALREKLRIHQVLVKWILAGLARLVLFSIHQLSVYVVHAVPRKMVQVMEKSLSNRQRPSPKRTMQRQKSIPVESRRMRDEKQAKEQWINIVQYCNDILPNPIGCYGMLQDLTKSYRILQDLTKSYRILQDLTINPIGSYRILPNPIGSYRISPNPIGSITGSYQIL
ncbi:hypothetical protein OS493_008343 [Desmophyllum pertusum]|uniref:Uncharacterized protein n=1 Tax=Desmophyllum pertusum TaxID=174260 RepID=A0A9X0A433_9CNID|nr:hypothetical protein OS493_008343 [Desmophyllum pertusum]